MTLLLEQARQARRDGDLPLCVALANDAAVEAEKDRDAETAYHALACVGRLHLSREESTEALCWFRRALEAAAGGGLIWRLAGAYHDMFLASRECGNRPSARRYAGTAHDIYAGFARGHPYMVALAADVAQCDFEHSPTHENAAHALQAWRACPVSIPEPRVGMIAATNEMHAASVVNRPSRFTKAAQSFADALGRLPDRESAARCLVTASEAARRVGDYPRAAGWAERAELIAESRGEDVVRQRAEAAKEAALAERAYL